MCIGEASGMKRCTGCGVEKPANANYFYPLRAGLMSRCRDCRRSYARQRYNASGGCYLPELPDAPVDVPFKRHSGNGKYWHRKVRGR
jgi:hypothetical protein